MIEFKNVLVSLDFSRSSTSAMKVAISLAKSLGAELQLVHVYSYPLQIAVAAPVPQTSDVQRTVRQQGQDGLEAMAALAEEHGLTATTHLLEGQSVAPTLVQLAKDLDVDLIVLGRRGIARLKEIMLGSVADHTVRLAPCPVLIVRAVDGDEETAAGE